MDNFFLEHTFCTAIGRKGYHSHDKITIFGNYKYCVKLVVT